MRKSTLVTLGALAGISMFIVVAIYLIFFKPHMMYVVQMDYNPEGYIFGTPNLVAAEQTSHVYQERDCNINPNACVEFPQNYAETHPYVQPEYTVHFSSCPPEKPQKGCETLVLRVTQNDAGDLYIGAYVDVRKIKSV